MIKTLRRFKAKLLGTFVGDCPLCHKHFYGHKGFALQTKINGITYRIICQECLENQELKLLS